MRVRVRACGARAAPSFARCAAATEVREGPAETGACRDGTDLAEMSYNLFKCPSCERDICLKCNCQEHDGYTCAQYAAWKAENEAGEEKFGGLLAGGVVKLCPNCASPIEKNDGCNFITCQHCKCKEGFCWETGKPRFGPNGCGGGHNCH